MAAKTYTVGSNSGVRRLDDLTLPWVNVPLNLAPFGFPINVLLRDVMTDPLDGSKVFVVGGRDLNIGATGIYVSSNAGAVWTQPTGDINSSAYSFSEFHEVWVVNSNVIYACGGAGYVFKSTDGGASFNKTLTLPTPSGLPDGDLVAYALHFIDEDTGVVTLNNYVFKTSDGGDTWIMLNGSAAITTPVNPELFFGVHLSTDEQTIVALGLAAIYRSVDGGNNWSMVYEFVNRNGQHLTWINDTTLWGMGTGGEIVKSVDSGANWSILSVFNSLGPTHRAGHIYNNPDGFYGADFDIRSTSDGFNSGTLSETSPYGVNAVWTFYEEDPEQPCGCPEGFIYNFETEECDGFEITDVIVSSTIYTGIQGAQSLSYGFGGANFYENIDDKVWPIRTDPGNYMEDTADVPLVIQQNVQNDLWGDVQTPDTMNGRLNIAGIWADNVVGVQWLPQDEWIGFTVCIDVPETKEYHIGMGADNKAQLKINGDLVVRFNGCTPGFNINFTHWHVFPITLQAGLNVLHLEGLNCADLAAFAAEIYDATLGQLTAMTLTSQLEAVTVFSTLNQIGEEFDTGVNSGYSCPQGWYLSLCNGAYQCVRQISVDFEPCNCYLARNCEDPDDTMLFTAESALDLDMIYKLEGSDKCWSIEVSVDCPPNDETTAVTESFFNCPACLGVCYDLVDCLGEEETIRVDNDLSALIGQVVKISSCADICWQVNVADDCAGTTTVTLQGNYTDCETCLPEDPEEPVLTPTPRMVYPEPESDFCDINYIEKVSCNFSDAVYQHIISRRYGIKFCCPTDLRKWMIKFELMQLNELHDPNFCPVAEDDCCSPCDCSPCS